MPEPKVGRIVHFYTMDSAKHFDGLGAGPYAALITAVENRGISLFVMAPSRAYHEMHVTEGDGKSGMARWFQWPAIDGPKIVMASPVPPPEEKPSGSTVFVNKMSIFDGLADSLVLSLQGLGVEAERTAIALTRNDHGLITAIAVTELGPQENAPGAEGETQAA